MSFGTAVSTCFQKYADFSGRAKLPEFWWFFLFCCLVNIGCSIVEAALGIGWGAGWGPITAVAGLVLLVPNFSVGARRLHDTGKSGWWQLLFVVPCIGFIALIIMWCQASDLYDNKYGPAVAQRHA